MAYPTRRGASISGAFSFTGDEIRDLIKAWAAISIAFTILLLGGANFFRAGITGIVSMLLISCITVGMAFVLHELAHKYLAIRYGCQATFKAFDKWLIISIVSAFFGFIFAVPGAVFIRGSVTYEKNGRIAAAGPATNLVLFGLFALFAFSAGPGMLRGILRTGAWINAFLAFFNMLPFGNFDGLKVMIWNRTVFYAMIGAGILSIVIAGAI